MILPVCRGIRYRNCMPSTESNNYFIHLHYLNTIVLTWVLQLSFSSANISFGFLDLLHL